MVERGGLLIGASLWLLGSAPDFAIRAQVTHKKSSCDWFLAESTSGYILMEWYGGNDPDEGDMLAGALHSYGFKDIYNVTSDAEMRVYIEDFMLAKDDALEQMLERCN